MRLDKSAVQRVLLLMLTFYATLAFSILVPFIWKAELYVDGQRILESAPLATRSASSFEVASWALQPVFGLLTAFGIDLSTYGTKIDSDILIVNGVFGTVSLVLVGAVMLLHQVPYRWDLEAAVVVGTIVLLGPFAFIISKEVIPLAVGCALLILARTFSWPPWALALSWAVALIAMAQYFRAYYMISGLLIFLSFLVCRRNLWLLAALYGGFFAFLFVGHGLLPLDLVKTGRSDYLADVTSSRIEYYFNDDSALLFAVNRVVTFLNLCVPVLLPLKSIAYTPFAAMQLVVTYRMLRVLFKERDDQVRLLAAHVVLAFTAVSALYEPDYGSFFRHKVGTLAFLVLLMSSERARRRAEEADAASPPPRREPDPPPLRENEVSMPRAALRVATPRRDSPALRPGRRAAPS